MELEDGAYVSIQALYFRPSFEQHLNLKSILGIEYTDAGHIEVNNQQQTNLSGVYAIGDCTTPFRSVSIATAQGSMAGAFVNHELIAET